MATSISLVSEHISEAVVWSGSVEKVFLEISQNS